MSFNNVASSSELQAYVLSSENKPPYQEDDTGDTNENEQDAPGIEQDDPLRERILGIVMDLLKNNTEITIQDVVDNSNIKESPIRHRLGQLVSMGKLSFAAGTGRRPNYYFLPRESNDATPDLDNLHELAKFVKQKEQDIHRQIAILQAELEKVSIDLSTIERTIEIKEEYRGVHE
jgi:predicted transcriptional regulator